MEKKELEKLVEKLQADVRTYSEAGAEMGNEIRTLKLRLAGSKGLNKQLQSKVEHYKDLCLEGDKLNEEKIAKIEKLEKECESYKHRFKTCRVPSKRPCTTLMLKNRILKHTAIGLGTRKSSLVGKNLPFHLFLIRHGSSRIMAFFH